MLIVSMCPEMCKFCNEIVLAVTLAVVENDNWLRILYNLTVCEDARSFERTDHRADSDASTDFKIFAASLFCASTRERCAFSTRDLVLKIAAHAKEMAQAPIWEI